VVAVRAGAILLAENHERDAMLGEDPLHELDPEPSESVTVGNHNLLDLSCVRALQNGAEAPPVPVESRSNVLDELVSWSGGEQVRFLPFEVPPLVLRTVDPGVDDPDSLPASVRLVNTKDALDVGDAVQVLASWHAHGGESALAVPPPQGLS
jgi:hypothetical protein